MIVLVSDKETLTWELGGSTLLYRRVPALKQAEIQHKHSTFGILNEGAYRLEMCEYALTGWEHVTTADNVAVPFETRLVGTLPTAVILQLMGKIQEVSPELVIKNSPAPSSDASPSAA
jgi:hypothetical protein